MYLNEIKKFSAEVYIKGQLVLNDYPKSFFGKSLTPGNFDSVKNRILFLSETISDYYVDVPNKERIEVKSSKVSGRSGGFGLSNPQIISFYQNNIALPYAIDIIGFGDEEGTRFGSTLLGSRAVAGTWNPEWWELKDRNGISLKQAFIDFGLDPDNIHSAARNPDDLLAYLEVHIEQGPVLEDENLALGIVTAIAGARRFAIEIQGYAGHAGTVPMPMRKDALVGAALGIVLVEDIAKEFDVVATVGKIECGPGAVNVIPGHATFTIDIRSGDDQLRDQAFAKIQHELDMICLNRNLVARWTEIHNAPAVVCADWIQALQASVLRDMNLHPYTLMSGAGHDAMAMAQPRTRQHHGA